MNLNPTLLAGAPPAARRSSAQPEEAGGPLAPMVDVPEQKSPTLPAGPHSTRPAAVAGVKLSMHPGQSSFLRAGSISPRQALVGRLDGRISLAKSSFSVK